MAPQVRAGRQSPRHDLKGQHGATTGHRDRRFGGADEVGRYARPVEQRENIGGRAPCQRALADDFVAPRPVARRDAVFVYQDDQVRVGGVRVDLLGLAFGEFWA